ncbi:MAG TPA: VanW family protein [Acidimicrobiales bacterium]
MDGNEDKPAPVAGEAGRSAGPVDRGAAGPARSGSGPGAPPPGPGQAPTAEQPKIFTHLPDGDRSGRSRGREGTPVLGGAAAAEGRTTGPNPRIAGPVRAPGDAEGSADAGEDGGRHFAPAGADRNWWPLAAAGVPLLALALLVVGWAIDTAALSGQVMRNVEVAGRSVGGLGEASLPDVMEEINGELATRPVVVQVEGAPAVPGSGLRRQAQPGEPRRYETTAGELGLAVDTEATAEAALDAGRSDALLARPFIWFTSFFSPREVDVEYAITESQLVAKMLELQGADIRAAHDPTIQLTDAGWVAVPGQPGQGVDTDEIIRELPGAAAAAAEGPIEIDAELVDVAPRFTDEEAQAVADRANAMAAGGLSLATSEGDVQVAPEQIRTWLAPTTADGSLELEIRADAVQAALPELFADIVSEPVDASIDLQGGTPVVVPAQPGVACCGEDSVDRIWQALQAGETTVELEVTVTEPELTTEEAEALGIVRPVGGNHAWRNGAPTTAGPGFTTYHDPGQPRVVNIHRIADLVRGAVILPGETFSVNEHVGPRTAAKGFVPAGAIRNGEHVDEIGGGVSQFATTLFNAAYFAGLDIPVSQAHSEYFTRYPRGREATMGHPAPDLQITNNTPYGILIWTSYTDTSITVTLYSTPYATGEQTGISESPNGNCTNVTTTRTRTYPDGRTETDTFRATYRPGEGETC